MGIEVLEDNLLEQRLEVESRLITVDVRVAVKGQNGTDVRVLEFDGAFRSALKQAPKTFVVPRLIDAQTCEFVAKHREVVANRGLDFFARPILAGPYLSLNYDLGYFDDKTSRLEPLENPFGPTVLPMSPE